MRVRVCRATLGPSQETLKYHKANRGYCINRLSRLLTEGTTGVKHPAKPVTGKSDAYALESLREARESHWDTRRRCIGPNDCSDIEQSEPAKSALTVRVAAVFRTHAGWVLHIATERRQIRVPVPDPMVRSATGCAAQGNDQFIRGGSVID